MGAQESNNPFIQQSKTITRARPVGGNNSRQGQIKIVERKLCQYV